MITRTAEALAYFSTTSEQECDALGESGIAAILERGKRWPLHEALGRKGVLVFPHVHIADCGPYTAAVVNACLDSGTDQVLAIGVLHTFTDEMEAARTRISANAEALENEPLRGIYGEG